MRIGLQTWGTQGDVEPFIALAAVLAARGHAVRLVATTQSDKQYQVASGVQFERVGPDMTQADGDALMNRVIALSSPMAQGRMLLEEGFLVGEDAMREAADDLVADSDIVVRHHFLYMTRIAAEKLGKPELSVFLTPDLLPTKQHPPTGMPSFGPLQSFAWWLADRGISGIFGPPAAKLRAAAGLPRSKGVLQDVWRSASGNLIAVSPALFPRPTDWPTSHHLTGFWNGPSTTDAVLSPDLDTFLETGTAPVYASFGSMAGGSGERRRDDARLLIEAARNAGRRVVLQQPPGDAPEIAGDDVLCVTRAPHSLVFPRCAAVVHHGGAGTTQTAIRAGVPSVIVPHLADQFFWASQIEELGVGVAGQARTKITPAKLGAALARTDSDAMRERVQALAVALAAEDGTKQAADVIEAIASRQAGRRVS